MQQGSRALRQAKAMSRAVATNKSTMLRMRFYRFRLGKGYGHTAAWMPRSDMRKLLHAWQHVVAARGAGNTKRMQPELSDDHKQDINKALAW